MNARSSNADTGGKQVLSGFWQDRGALPGWPSLHIPKTLRGTFPGAPASVPTDMLTGTAHVPTANPVRLGAWVSRVALLLVLLPLQAAGAQTADTLAEARVEAARGRVGVRTAPFSVAVVLRSAEARASAAGAGLDVALRSVPGLAVTGRENPSQGERLTVRGVGARAAFGVRGVQVVLDGVPLTLADGQAVLGIVDPALVRRAEIVRGPASALWGNGSGGVLFLDTVAEVPVARVQATGGGFGLRRLEGEIAARAGRAGRVGAAISYTRADGFRDHAAFETSRARVFADARLSPRVSLRLVAAVEDAPRLENPGALTLAELDTDPRQAEARAVQTASGKASRQGQGAATLRFEAPLATVTATVYGVARGLDNPLPFAYVAVDRLAGGTRAAAERTAGPLGVTLGVDTAVQRDRRTNRPNEAGTPGAALLLDQTETVTTLAAFVRARLSLERVGLPGIALDAALRGDRVRFAATDRRLDDGDQSGTRTLAALSPQVGLSARLGAATAFASVSTAFETPTATELVNRPDGGGGFNPDVGPQRTLGVEAGLRGVAGRRVPVLYDVAVYALAVRDGLTPAEAPDGRTFYSNRARIAHRGAEASAETRVGSVSASATYAWTRVRFGRGVETADGTGVKGRVVPGIPAHRVAVRVQAERRGVFVAPELVAQSGVFADDLNTVRTGASVVADLTVGHVGLRAGRAVVAPFVRAGNVFGSRAVVSVVANARGGRFFEPSAGRSVQAGLSVRMP